MYKNLKVKILTGVKGSGKSTFAKELIKNTSDDTIILNFADYVIKSASIVFDINLENLKIYEEWKLHNRKYLVNIGEGFKKLFGEDIWATLTLYDADTFVLNKVCEDENTEILVIITDLRFGIEWESLKESILFKGAKENFEVIMCNYVSDRYNFNEDEPAQKLPIYLLNKGYNHGDIININDIEEFVNMNPTDISEYEKSNTES